MSVDLTNDNFAPDGGAGSSTAVFLRFNVDSTVAGKTVTAVTLSLKVGSQGGNESNSTGDVWRVSAFTRPALFSGVPSKVGSTPVAGDLGAASLGATITFTLPSGLPQASTPLYLGRLPGLDQWHGLPERQGRFTAHARRSTISESRRRLGSGAQVRSNAVVRSPDARRRRPCGPIEPDLLGSRPGADR